MKSDETLLKGGWIAGKMSIKTRKEREEKLLAQKKREILDEIGGKITQIL